ncbi:MAG TPA: citryl-CoA lyase [Firmicutes bacterium]|nr:citryl-CoA lyase [Bacillota bacterium]
MGDLHWDTKVTDVAPNKVMVRGYRIDELMGKVSFAQAIWLILMGELPDENKTKLIEAIFVSSIDHGASPPSCLAARTVASTGANLSASVAAGIMSINRHHGGAIEGCFLALDSALKKANESGMSFDEAAEAVIAEHKEKKKFVPGFGHRLHTADPRTARLFKACEDYGFVGDYLKMARSFEKAFEKGGKSLPLNVDGALGAVLGDLGVPPMMMNGFFMVARVPGLLAHVYEEMTAMKPMRKIDPSDFGYTGPEERHLK